MKNLFEVDKINHKINKAHYYIISIIVLGLLTTVGISLYASYYSGTFVMTVGSNNDYRPGIEISETAYFESPISQLNASSPVLASGVSYSTIKLNEIMESEGHYVDPDYKYLAYSFYLLNSGTATVSVVNYMRFTRYHDHMGEYLRILVIEDDLYHTMYQKSDLPLEDDEIPEYDGMPNGETYLSDHLVFRKTIHEFRPGEIKLYRAIVWLEDQDPDAKDFLSQASIEILFTFTTNQEEQVGQASTMFLTNPKKMWIPLSTTCSVRLTLVYEGDQI
ncbi:MAG: hypothetical protein RBT45_05825 [Acholeplasmataceae bacterium]|jgi:hypothetical protein|nr:hypothetical protein [Acholeplasmataceae bacterium]